MRKTTTQPSGSSRAALYLEETMSRLPDTRQEYVEPPFSGTKGAKGMEKEPNAYYEGNLTEENKERIREYDFATENAKNVLMSAEEYAAEWDLDVRPSDIKAVLDALVEWFPDEMETRRNDYVISMIESQE